MAAGTVVGEAMVEVGLDTKKAEAQAAKFGGVLEDDLGKAAEDGARAATKAVTDAADKMTRALQEVARRPIDLTINADTTKSEAGLRTLEDQLTQAAADARAIGQQTITIRVQGEDLAALQADLTTVATDIEQVDAQTIDVTMNTADVEQAAGRVHQFNDEIGNTSARSVSSISGLRDVSGALGNVGSDALNAGDGLLGLGDTLETISPKFSGLAETLGIAGLAIAGLGVAGGIIDQISGNADKLATSMDHLIASTGQGTQAVQDFVDGLAAGRQSFGDIGATIANYQDVLSGNDPLKADAVKKFNEVLGKSPAAARNLLTSIEDLGPRAGFTADQIDQMTAALEAQVEGAAGADDATKAYNQTVEDQQKLLEHGLAIRRTDGESFDEWADKVHRAAAELTSQDAAAQHARDAQSEQAAALVAGLDRQAKAAADDAKNVDDLRHSFDDLNTTWDEGSQSAAAFNTVFSRTEDSMFAVHQGAADVEDGIAQLVKGLGDSDQAFKDTGFHISSLSDAGRSALDNTQALGKAIGSDLAAELANAGGNFDVVRKKAEDYRGELVDQMTQLGLTSDEQQNYLEFLGLTPDQIETAIKLSGQEEARQKLQLLNADINTVPTSIKTDYIAAIAAGDYEKALALLEQGAEPRPAPYKPEVDQHSASVVDAELDKLGKSRTVDFFGTVHAPGAGQMAGGPVEAGSILRVGEVGWETFVPGENGRILPHWESTMLARQAMALAASSGGGGGQSVVYNIGPNQFGSEPNSTIKELTWAVRYRMRTVA